MLNPRTLVALALCVLASATSLAATLTVTTTADSGPGSLREALAFAVDGEVIEFSVTGTITLTSGQLLVDDSVTITGPGQEDLTISGNEANRVIEIAAGKEVALSGLTISNGLTQWDATTCCSGGGAGICNQGIATLMDVTISDNLAAIAAICNEGDMTLIRLSLTDYRHWEVGLALYNSGSMTMADSLVRGGGYGEPGGVGDYIENEGILYITDTEIIDNVQAFVNGGFAELVRTVIRGGFSDGWVGISNGPGAELRMIDSELSDISGYASGGLWNAEGGNVLLLRTSVNDNHSVYYGNIENDGSMELINSTVSNNHGGWYTVIGNRGTLKLTSSTVAENSIVYDHPEDAEFSATLYNRGTLQLARSILLSSGPEWEGRIASPCRGDGTVVSLGDNIFSDESCGLTGPGDMTGDPLLGPLADNGGPTLTMALLPGSPAIDAVPVERCTDADGAPLLVDQRGIPRPQGAACDIGAFELEAIPVEIDIRPGSDLNPVNSVSRGVIPVAILGSDSFDVSHIDTQTLGFGPAGAAPRHDLLDSQTFENHLGDVNEDGLADLVSHYRTQDTGIGPEDEEACVTGRTLEGIPFEGCDSIKTPTGRRRQRR